MWELFKDKNEYNEKNMVNDYIYNSFVWVTLGSFGISASEKTFKK